VVERLARNPDHFTVKCYSIEAGRQHVLQFLADELAVSQVMGGKSRVRTVISVVSTLLGRVRRLPPYTMHSRSVSPLAQAVRTALLSAREPDELLFVTLPEACGISPLAAQRPISTEMLAHYAGKLTEALAELEGFYSTVIDALEDDLARATGTPVAGLREQLRARAMPLKDRVIEPSLRAFVHGLIDDQLDEQEWIEHLAMAVASKAMTTWTDTDRSTFHQRLSQLGAAFRRIEDLHYDQSCPPGEGFEAIRVTVTRPDGTDVPRVVWVDDGAREAVDGILSEMLADVTAQLGPRGAEMALALLSEHVLLNREHAEGRAVKRGPNDVEEAHG